MPKGQQSVQAHGPMFSQYHTLTSAEVLQPYSNVYRSNWLREISWTHVTLAWPPVQLSRETARRQFTSRKRLLEGRKGGSLRMEGEYFSYRNSPHSKVEGTILFRKDTSPSILFSQYHTLTSTEVSQPYCLHEVIDFGNTREIPWPRVSRRFPFNSREIQFTSRIRLPEGRSGGSLRMEGEYFSYRNSPHSKVEGTILFRKDTSPSILFSQNLK